MDKMYMNTHATILKHNVELNIEYYKMILKMITPYGPWKPINQYCKILANVW